MTIIDESLTVDPLSAQLVAVPVPAGKTGPEDDLPARPNRVLGLLKAALLNPGLTLAYGIVAVVGLFCFWPSLFTSYDPEVPNPIDALQGPSATHLFGTDRLGRDIWSRVVHGAITTMSATLVAVAISLAIGILLGLVAGYFRGAFDVVLMRVIDIKLSVPMLLLTMVIVTSLGFGVMNAAFAVGISSVAGFSRVMRAEVLKVSQTDYVEAARGLGTNRLTILFRHVLPNSLQPVLALVPVQFGHAILAISALGFLGFGALPPQPEWGLMVAEGRDLLAVAPWCGLFPGAAIMVVVLASNRISHQFRKAG